MPRHFIASALMLGVLASRAAANTDLRVMEVVGFSRDGTSLLLEQTAKAHVVYLVSASGGTTASFRLSQDDGQRLPPDVCTARMKDLATALTAARVEDVALRPEGCRTPQPEHLPSSAHLVDPVDGPGNGLRFDVSSDYRDPRRDQLRRGKWRFKLERDRLVLYEGRARRAAFPKHADWSELGMLGAVLGPKQRFIVILVRIGDWEWSVSSVFRSEGGSLKDFRVIDLPAAR